MTASGQNPTLEQLLTDCALATNANDWRAARDLAQRALAIDPSHRTATRLVRHATRELVEDLLDAAEDAAARGDRTAATVAAAEALQLDPGNAAALAYVQPATAPRNVAPNPPPPSFDPPTMDSTVEHRTNWFAAGFNGACGCMLAIVAVILGIPLLLLLLGASL